MIWLTSDLLRSPLRELRSREQAFSPGGNSGGVKAAVFKLPHHGAKNGWFTQISAELTRCQPEDVIVVSAGGGAHHPHPTVWNYWAATGKKLAGTWNPASQPARGRIGGWAADGLDAVSRPLVNNASRDITVAVGRDGTVTVNTADSQE